MGRSENSRVSLFIIRCNIYNTYNSQQPEAPLPENWDMNTTEEGVRYFIDHKNKTTTFQDPRTAQNGQANPTSGVKSFRWKYGQFRYLCQSNAMTQVIIIYMIPSLISISVRQDKRLQRTRFRRIVYRNNENQTT